MPPSKRRFLEVDYEVKRSIFEFGLLEISLADETFAERIEIMREIEKVDRLIHPQFKGLRPAMGPDSRGAISSYHLHRILPVNSFNLPVKLGEKNQEQSESPGPEPAATTK